MKIGMTLTLDGLIRALRWQGITLAETKPAAEKQSVFEPVGEPARTVVDRVKAKRAKHGI